MLSRENLRHSDLTNSVQDIFLIQPRAGRSILKMKIFWLSIDDLDIDEIVDCEDYLRAAPYGR